MTKNPSKKRWEVFVSIIPQVIRTLRFTKREIAAAAVSLHINRQRSEQGDSIQYYDHMSELRKGDAEDPTQLNVTVMSGLHVADAT